MFGKLSFLIYMLLFTLIPIVGFWALNFRFLKKNIKVIGKTAVVAVVFQLITDPFAEIWKAWFFSDDKILGIWIYNFPIEDTIFALLCAVALSSGILTFIHFSKIGFDKILKWPNING